VIASKQSKHSKKQQGFTLLEVLVAFAIMGVALGTLLQTFAMGLRNTALSEEYTQAMLHAESVLAGLGVEEPLTEGDLSGKLDDKYAWRGSVSVYEEPEGPELPDNGLIPYHVQITVYWQDESHERSVSLETLRISLEEGFR
jgi:general secretion pathway protein I